MKISKYCLGLLFIFSIIIAVLIFKYILLDKEFDAYARLTNNLQVARNFEIYAALKENNITKIQNNLEINFMFQLKPIEFHGIKNVLLMKKIDHICNEYNKISIFFEKEYNNKYPSAIKDLKTFCK